MWPGYANIVVVTQFYRFHLPNSQGHRRRPMPVGPVEALTGGFYWTASRQGYDFWSDIVRNLGGWGSP